MDILYEMKDSDFRFSKFDFDNPILFAQGHIHYILVCSTVKNPTVYTQIKNHALVNSVYTPPFMQRLKDYLFKDAYIYGRFSGTEIC